MVNTLANAHRLLRYAHTVAPSPGQDVGEKDAALIDKIRGQGIHLAGVVVSVPDGDGIKCRGTVDVVSIRLLGLDAPEIWQPNAQPQKHAIESQRILARLVHAQRVVCICDTLQPRLDRYGRLLAYIIRQDDELLVNAELLRQGAARAFPAFPCRLTADFAHLEATARRARVGIWAPGGGGEQTANLVLS